MENGRGKRREKGREKRREKGRVKGERNRKGKEFKKKTD